MPNKGKDKGKKTTKKNVQPHSNPTYTETSSYVTSTTTESPRCVILSVMLQEDEDIDPVEFVFFILFNGQVLLDCPWENGLKIDVGELPLNLNEPFFQDLVADKPLLFIIRSVGGKVARDPDPLLNIDNYAGGTVDLLPLLLGEEIINVKLPLILISTGSNTPYSVVVNATTNGISNLNNKVPLVLTMISCHCLPPSREGTVYTVAMGLENVIAPPVVNFGMSLSTSFAQKIVWATLNTVGQAANTAISVPNEDKFVPSDLDLRQTEKCSSFYWNSMKRILVEPLLLKQRLSSVIGVELAGGSRTGKVEVRGRYMGFIDPGVLLEPGQFGVTMCVRLMFYNEANLSERCGPLLDLPPPSAKSTARDHGSVMDQYSHNAYICVRFDLTEPLVSKFKIATLFEIIGFPSPEVPAVTMDELHVEPPPEDNTIDVKRVSKEAGALAVHVELSNLACRGAVQMNQSIKRTAANRLLMRVRSMLKQFSPGQCSSIDFHNMVTKQHAACRRAVTASFAPQPPPLRPSARFAASRCRQSGDYDIAVKHIDTNLIVAPEHPRPLLSKALRFLEQRIDSEAITYIMKALSVQTRNRYLLWIYGGQEFDKGSEAIERAAAAFRIAAKGDYSDATASAIGWAALHCLQHHKGNPFAAFVAARKMRKSYELSKDWRGFLMRWIESSGEEEVFWIPEEVGSQNPIMIAAAFFLCLRCYKFTDTLLKCVENGCATRGSRVHIKIKIGPDIHYLRAASLLLRRRFDEALRITQEAIKIFGPTGKMYHMRASCLACAGGWDGLCESAFITGESLGGEPSPSLLLQAAIGGMETNPQGSLQYAARAHEIAPSARSALVIGRIYAILGEESLATRWAAVAVKTEPILADGWAFLALLAMKERNPEKAKALLRTAKQTGTVSPEIDEEVQKIKEIIQLKDFPDTLVDDLCLCSFY